MDQPSARTAGHAWCRRAGASIKLSQILWHKVWPVSSGEAWLVGNTADYVSVPDVPEASGYSHQGVLAHWDGQTLCAVGMGGIFGHKPSSSDLREVAALRAIWGSSPNDIWIGGDDGAAAHWDGREWTEIEVGKTNDNGEAISEFVGDGPGNIFALVTSAANQYVLRWDGVLWKPYGIFPKGASLQGLGGIWLDGTGRLWWYTRPPGISLRNDCDVYVVSSGAVTCSLSLDKYYIYEILAMDGTGNHPWLLLKLRNLKANRDETFVVEHTDAGWNYRMLKDFKPSALRVFSSTDVWAAGERSTQYWNGTQWSEVAQKRDVLAPKESWIMGVYGETVANVWAIVGTGTFPDSIGDRGLLRGDGTNWQQITP
jgi:hypothetical protein